MGINSLASGASCWRGLDYYKNKKIKNLTKINDYEYTSTAIGTNNYNIYLDVSHPRKSICTCPLAKGKRIICKHIVATFFTAFPEEAKKFEEEQERLQEEYEDYQEKRQNIEQHINNIYDDNELPKSTCKKFLQVQKEGGRKVKRNIDHYNLDMIIALGYRVQSDIAVRFRIWATQRLHEYIQKGFTMDDNRLKQGGNRYFKELFQRIRDIRSSERNFYQQVTDIYATSIDYDPRSEITKKFFATVQNKLHYAVHEQTAAELIYNRVDNEKPYVGMTNFKGNYVTMDDVKIAKNYLSEIELQRLNLLVSQFLDFAELQALEQRTMKMNDWVAELDNQILLNRRKILEGNGKVSHEEAIKKAEKEFQIYREREMKELQSDFDLLMKSLSDKGVDSNERK